MAAGSAHAVVQETDADRTFQIGWHRSYDDQLRKFRVNHPETEWLRTK
jgi:hypothetical protein